MPSRVFEKSAVELWEWVKYEFMYDFMIVIIIMTIMIIIVIMIINTIFTCFIETIRSILFYRTLDHKCNRKPPKLATVLHENNVRY